MFAIQAPVFMKIDQIQYHLETSPVFRTLEAYNFIIKQSFYYKTED